MTDANNGNGGAGSDAAKDAGAGASDNNDKKTTTTPPTDEKKFSQADMDAAIKKRLEQTVPASEHNKLKGEYERSKLTEAERREAEVAAKIKEADERAQKAEGALRLAYAEKLLIKEGIDPSRAGRVIGQTDEETAANVKAYADDIKKDVAAKMEANMKKGAPPAGQPGAGAADGKTPDYNSLRRMGYTDEQSKAYLEKTKK